MLIRSTGSSPNPSTFVVPTTVLGFRNSTVAFIAKPPQYENILVSELKKWGIPYISLPWHQTGPKILAGFKAVIVLPYQVKNLR
jgi:hypothetical protein